MAERFTDFIIRLAEDPKALDEFRRDPDSALKRADISPAEQSILASANPAIIRDAIVADIGKNGGDAAAEWVVVLVIVKSGLEQLASRGFGRFGGGIR